MKRLLRSSNLKATYQNIRNTFKMLRIPRSPHTIPSPRSMSQKSFQTACMYVVYSVSMGFTHVFLSERNGSHEGDGHPHHEPELTLSNKYTHKYSHTKIKEQTKFVEQTHVV